MAIQHVFFIFSVVVPCLALILLDKRFDKKSEKLENSKLKWDWFIDTMCNVLVPFSAIFGNLQLFLGINLVFFCVPIYSATKAT
jgi:hypothetical protein